MNILNDFITYSGFANVTLGHIIMIVVAGVLLYHLDTDTKVVEVKAYMIKDEFKGIGLFHLLFDTLCEKMKIKGIDNLILDYYDESLQIEPMFREITTKNLKKSVYLSIYSWIDSIK